ncbi:hypothetical protein BJ944DRAFT_245215, partial [Cunninghamella echinulata]
CNYTIGDKRDCYQRPEYIIPCDLKAPTEICTPTTSSILIDRMLIDTPTLGLILYYSQWVFLGVMMVGSLVAFCMKPRQHEESIEDVDEEEQGLLANSQPHQQQRSSPSYH